jgi:hypothetical protein
MEFFEQDSNLGLRTLLRFLAAVAALKYQCIRISLIDLEGLFFVVSLPACDTRNKGTNEHDWKETAIFSETSINT